MSCDPTSFSEPEIAPPVNHDNTATAPDKEMSPPLSPLSPTPSGRVVTLSCQETPCPSCDSHLDSVPNFLNQSHSTCLICSQLISSDSTSTPPSGDTVKVLKEICIRSILPEVVLLEDGFLDGGSFPFCGGCASSSLAPLATLFRQLLVLQETFDEARFTIVAPILDNLVRVKGHDDGNDKVTEVWDNHDRRSGDQLFRYWKRYLSYPTRIEDPPLLEEEEEEEGWQSDRQGQGQEGSIGVRNMRDKLLIPLPIPDSSGDEEEDDERDPLSEDDDEFLRIKTEPLDTSTMTEWVDGGGVNELFTHGDGGLSFQQNDMRPLNQLEDFNPPSNTRDNLLNYSRFDGTLSEEEPLNPKSKLRPRPKSKRALKKNPSIDLIHKGAKGRDDKTARAAANARKRRLLNRKLLLRDGDSLQKLAIIPQHPSGKGRKGIRPLDSLNTMTQKGGNRINVLTSHGHSHFQNGHTQQETDSNQSRKRCRIETEAPRPSSPSDFDFLGANVKTELESPCDSGSEGGGGDYGFDFLDQNSPQSPTPSNYIPESGSFLLVNSGAPPPKIKPKKKKKKVENDGKIWLKKFTRRKKSSNPAGRRGGRPRKNQNQSSGDEHEDQLNLLKCTPHITEGVGLLDVKIQPHFLEEGEVNVNLVNVNREEFSPVRGRRGGRGGRGRGRGRRLNSDIFKERGDLGANNYFEFGEVVDNSEDEIEEVDGEEHESERIRRIWATDSPPKKRKRSSITTAKRGGRGGGRGRGRGRGGRNSFPIPIITPKEEPFTQGEEGVEEEEYFHAMEEQLQNATSADGQAPSSPNDVDLLGPDLLGKKKMGEGETKKKRKKGDKGTKKVPSIKIKIGNQPQTEQEQGVPSTARIPVLQLKRIKVPSKRGKGAKTEPKEGLSEPSLLGGDAEGVVDLSDPSRVSAFSSLLTQNVTSLLKDLDPSPNPSPGRRRKTTAGSGFYAEPGDDIDSNPANSDHEPLDPQGPSSPALNSSSSSSSSPPPAKKPRHRRRKHEIDPSLPKPKRIRPPRPKKVRVTPEGVPIPQKRNRRPVFGPKNKKIHRPRDKTPQMCYLCGKILVSEWNLTVHMRTHTDDRRYPCTVPGCGKRFFKTENLVAHTRTHTKERPYVCDSCGCRFSYRIVLRTHKAARHGIYDCEGVWECRACGEKAIAENWLRKHLRICERRRKGPPEEREDYSGNIVDCRVWCNYCERQFQDGDQFREHAAKDPKHVEIKKAKILDARKDLVEFNKAKELKGGGGVGEGEEAGVEEEHPFKCHICGENEVDGRLLKLHINRIHPARGSATCEFCGKAFSTPGNLKVHLIIHSEEKPFVCSAPNCGAKFNSKQGLRGHEESRHEDPHPCPYCGKGIRKERALRRHLATTHREVHLRERPAVCPSCYRNYATARELDEHLASEHRDVTCMSCGKVFGYRYDLNRHMKRDHNASDPMPPRKEGEGDEADEAGESVDEEEEEGQNQGHGGQHVSNFEEVGVSRTPPRGEERIAPAAVITPFRSGRGPGKNPSRGRGRGRGRGQGRPRSMSRLGPQQEQGSSGGEIRELDLRSHHDSLFLDPRQSLGGGGVGGGHSSFHGLGGPLPLVSANFDQEFALLQQRQQQQQLLQQREDHPHQQNPVQHDFINNFMYNHQQFTRNN